MVLCRNNLKKEVVMEELFCKRLDNFWDNVTASKGKQKFLLMVVQDCSVIHAIVNIKYLKGDSAKVYFFTKSSTDNFTDGVFNSVFGGLSEIVRHYGGPGYKRLICKAVFGVKTRNYGWFLNQIIKGGSKK